MIAYEKEHHTFSLDKKKNQFVLFDLISTVLNDTYIALNGRLAYRRGRVKLLF